MSQAFDSFMRAIRDAESMLARFDAEKQASAATDGESLKRAGLVMAMAAWETYVKERVEDECLVYLRALEGSPVAKFVRRKLNEEMKRFFNPNSERTKRLFQDFFDVDITQGWKWANYQPDSAKKALDELVSKRGDAAHRAITSEHRGNMPHQVSRSELEKAIRFLKGLVQATEKVNIAR